jgi:hypothetical protein
MEARSAAYYRVTTELAAKRKVMERATSDLEEHQLVCASAPEVRQSGPNTSHVSTPRSGGYAHLVCKDRGATVGW